MPMRSGQLLALLMRSIATSIARGGHRVMRSFRRFERRAEQRQKSVAQKLVHDAAMAVQYLDQHRERTVQAIDDVLRGTRARGRGKTAEIDKHDRDASDVAGRTGAFNQ